MGLGDFVSGIFGSKNADYATAPKVDAGAYKYDNSSNTTSRGDAAMGQQAQQRTGPTIDTTNADQSRDMGLQSRGSQADAMGMMQQAAQGNAPSVAALQQQQGLNQAIASQQAMAAGARGPGGLAMAGYNAAANTAGMQQGAVNQAAQLRAGEMAQARGEYASQANAMRGGDQSQQGQDFSQGLAQSQLDAGQRQQNDQFQMGMQGMSQQAQEAQLAAQQEQQRLQSENQNETNKINAGVGAGNAATNQSEGEGLLGMASGALGMMSDARAKTDIRDVSGAPHVPGNVGGIMGGIMGGYSAAHGYGNPGLAMSGVNQNTIGETSGYRGPAAAMVASAPAQADPVPAEMRRFVRSDAGSKTAPASVQHAEPARFLDSLTTHAYKYKAGVPGEDPSREHYGPMAQEVERTPMGASIVQNTPQGKELDVVHGFGVALGALGNLNDRLRSLEGKKGGARA